MKNKSSKCAVCGGKLITKRVSYDQHWGEQLVLFEDVPASVCLDCGEIWLSAKTIKTMDNILSKKTKPTKKIQVPVWSLSGEKAA